MNSIKKNILILDKDNETRELIKELAQNEGYEISAASGVTEAIELFSKNKADLIITDIVLPDHSSGIDFIKHIRRTSQTLPIIVITKHEDSNDIYEFISSWIFACLKKPISDIESLKNAIKNALNHYETVIDRKFTKKYPSDAKLFVNEIAAAKQEWESGIDSLNTIVMLIDRDRIIKRCNKILSVLTGKTYKDLLGRKWDEVIRETGFRPLPGDFHLSGGIEFYNNSSGQWLLLQIHPLFEILLGVESVSRQIITIQPITELKKAVEEIKAHREKIRAQNRALEEAYEKLKRSQAQILHQEKMAAIGQLSAGVAHEINNPVGFITSNLNTFQKYLGKLTEFIKTQADGLKSLSDTKQKDNNELITKIEELRKSSKIDYIIEDAVNLISESLDGAERVKKIVQDLKTFSRVDEEDHRLADINAGLNSTINIVWNELKYKATLKKEYGNIPMTKCNQGQLNQVFMNILVNAAHAIEKQGEITVKTWSDNNHISISISDTGQGIPEEKINQIFEPFFTTKEKGKGTGLGLSIAYDIVKRHNGSIEVESIVGKGTTFIIKIPIVEK